MISMSPVEELHTLHLDPVTRKTLVKMLGGLDTPGPFETFLLRTLHRTSTLHLDPPGSRQMWFLLWLLTDRTYRGQDPEGFLGALWDHAPACSALKSLGAYDPVPA